MRFARSEAMKAVEIMSTPAVSVDPDAPLSEVAALLAARGISGVPVLEGERLVGVLSEADMLRARGARRAREAMNREVVAVRADTPVDEVAQVLESRGIRRVPVLDGEGNVLGIVSRSNLVQALALGAQFGTPRSDAALRDRLLTELSRQPWWSPEANVLVRDGVVHFWGPVDSEIEYERARAIARATPGVRAIEDHRFRRTAAPAGAPRARGIRRAAERAHSHEGWLESWHTFSFGGYYDPRHTGHGPLRAVNERLVRRHGGLTTYSLRDVDVVTYILEGALACEMSAGGSTILHPGDVQCVSAGLGVTVSERNCASAAEASGDTRYLQAWIVPARTGAEAVCESARIPTAARRGRLRLVCSPDGREGSLRLCQDAYLYVGSFDRGGGARLDPGPGRLGYVHVARGSIAVNGEQLSAGDGFAADGEPLELAEGRDAEVLVFDLPERAHGQPRPSAEELLDAAVELTFPASDPIAVTEAFRGRERKERLAQELQPPDSNDGNHY